MRGQDLAKYKLPDTPGVYFFKDGKEILYIGRATSLKSRVKSYFSKDLIETRGMFLVDMVTKAKKIEWQETDSVLEAILLEATLIKRHQPHYNTREKDDKSFNYVIITNDDFPEVLLVRQRELDTKFDVSRIKYQYGPFTSGGLLQEAMKMIRKIFPYFDKRCRSDAERPSMSHQIGLCPEFGISKSEYAKTIRNIKYFFEGKKKTLKAALNRDMKTYAKSESFEKAEMIKKQLFAIDHINDIALMKREGGSGKGIRIEAYDVAHTSGKDVVGVMTVVERGEMNKSAYRKFKLSQEKNDDVGNLKEILRRRLTHEEWQLPDMIVVDGSVGQKRAAEMVVKEFLRNESIPVIAVTKDERHRAARIQGDQKLISKHEADIVLANSEAHRFAINYHRSRRRIIR